MWINPGTLTDYEKQRPDIRLSHDSLNINKKKRFLMHCKVEDFKLQDVNITYIQSHLAADKGGCSN